MDAAGGDRIDIKNDRIDRNYCYEIPHMIKSYHQEAKNKRNTDKH
ncbi:hypothetical protein SAMN02910263_02138 [Butyrivibrio sp. INlla16]|nr:hypothetical protein SAMN02910263_02138 [Butyrivibrio sp. INlla16]